jgi:Tfp pilus assembly protein PilO
MFHVVCFMSYGNMSRVSLTIIFTIIGLALVGFVMAPGIKNIFALLEKQRAIAEVNAKLQSIMTSRDRLQAEYRAIPQEDIEKLDLLLPDGPEIGTLLSVYEAIAKRNGLLLSSIDFSGGVQARSGGGAQTARSANTSAQKIVKPSGSDIAPLPVVQSLQGSYDAFRRYLRDVEFLLNLTDISDISFSPTDLQNASFSVRGTTYYFAK